MSEQQLNPEAAADLTRVESLLEDLSKALTEQRETADADDTAQILAKGADAIITQNAELVETLTKSLDAVVSRLDAIESTLAALPALQEQITKGLNDIANAPLPSKAVTAEAEEAPAEVKIETPAVTKADVLSKALDQLQTAEGDRKVQLLRAVAHLDSNFNPASVAADFNI